MENAGAEEANAKIRQQLTLGFYVELAVTNLPAR
jgi:hypothetical protein